MRITSSTLRNGQRLMTWQAFKPRSQCPGRINQVIRSVPMRNNMRCNEHGGGIGLVVLWCSSVDPTQANWLSTSLVERVVEPHPLQLWQSSRGKPGPLSGSMPLKASVLSLPMVVARISSSTRYAISSCFLPRCTDSDKHSSSEPVPLSVTETRGCILPMPASMVWRSFTALPKQCKHLAARHSSSSVTAARQPIAHSGIF